MKLSEAPTKIIGVQIGELAVNFLQMSMDGTALKARFALLTDKGPTAFMDLNERGGQWSEKTITAMGAFAQALEEDALSIVFNITKETMERKEGSENEPSQF